MNSLNHTTMEQLIQSLGQEGAASITASQPKREDNHSPLEFLLSIISPNGMDFDIGGNSCHLLGRSEIDELQHFFTDFEEIVESKSIVFCTQQGFHPVAVSGAGKGPVIGGLAGGPLRDLGASLEDFAECMLGCLKALRVAGLDTVHGYDGTADKHLSSTLSRHPNVDKDAWIQYFY